MSMIEPLHFNIWTTCKLNQITKLSKSKFKIVFFYIIIPEGYNETEINVHKGKTTLVS